MPRTHATLDPYACVYVIFDQLCARCACDFDYHIWLTYTKSVLRVRAASVILVTNKLVVPLFLAVDSLLTPYNYSIVICCCLSAPAIVYALHIIIPIAIAILAHCGRHRCHFSKCISFQICHTIRTHVHLHSGLCVCAVHALSLSSKFVYSIQNFVYINFLECRFEKHTHTDLYLSTGKWVDWTEIRSARKQILFYCNSFFYQD